MYPGGFTVEVTTLSPRATEKDVRDFFSHCGAIEHLEIIRYLKFITSNANNSTSNCFLVPNLGLGMNWISKFCYI